MTAPQPPSPFGALSAATEAGLLAAQSIRERLQSERTHEEDVEEEQAGNDGNRRPSSTSETCISPDSISGDLPLEDQERVGALARHVSMLSRKSTDNGALGLVNPFVDNKDPQLDPNSDQFNSKKWVKTLLNIISRDPERYPQRTAGVSFRNLNVYGYGSATDYQADFANVWLKAWNSLRSVLGSRQRRRIDILRNFEGLVKSGEMLVVLGRPGSGCTTFLKTLSGETYGTQLDEGYDLQYQGISAEEMHGNFRGEVIYQAETETHFPQLTVGQTLLFAAKARAPRNRMPGVTRDQYAEHLRDVIMTIFGLAHTKNTRVGNEFIRGVSGGERKRVSIAEVALTGSPLQCWDNSTRGLDSATALEFVKSLRMSTEYAGSTAIVSIYQASQSIYDFFDKAILLYEGREIYFGPAGEAKEYFMNMGFDCPDRQTTGDFLTSLTNPAERIVRAGFENSVPRTPDEFAEVWRASPQRKALLEQIEEYEQEFPLGGEQYQAFKESRRAQQAKHTRKSSPYTISYPMQVRICLERGFQRLRGDMSMTLTSIFGNIIMALVISSVFYDLPANTGSFYSRGALLFYAILLNAFSSALEILTLYEMRPIVEKHSKYALYHPSAEAISSMIVDLPNKVIVGIVFNLVLYFMTNLRRTPGHFFVFFLFAITTTMTMSNIFRSIGAVSRTLTQALVPSSLFILSLVIYTGFTIPTRNMHPWFRWINYINPIAYSFESLMVNEFHDREFPCSSFIPMGPGYSNLNSSEFICSTTGSTAGATVVDGDKYINTSYKYYASNLWRNYGILIAFFIAFLITYLVASELVTAKPSKGEILVFRKGHIPSFMKNQKDGEKDLEEGPTEKSRVQNDSDETAKIHKQTAIFHWKDVCYDIKIKGQPRRLLDHVDGFVKPGTLTALMGVSGAGKTTLLDVLADRVTMGVVTGEMLVDGRPRDSSFQRKTGYVQQQDLHLETTTVREALIFSAELRQPKSTPNSEKIAYVDEVIKLLGMEEYAGAVVGVLGEGLNVEQRKRLTIGVELVAKPDLLLFFDEPTSGLDSQTAWSICTLMRKLADHGQAILCTIHQPSAMLMQQFDRLLFLARGGRTVYFGELGDNMSTLIDYFKSKGSVDCPPDANPAEWMLEVIGAAPGSHSDKDWAEVWTNSKERELVRQNLDAMKTELSQKPAPPSDATEAEFAMPLWDQYLVVQKRVFQQYWRSPTYMYSKLSLCVFTSLFIGFTFYKSPLSLQGLQNQMFSIFMLLMIFPNIIQQMMPYFCTQRALYEVRERPSKAYSWKAFIMSSLVVEAVWNTLMAILIFVCWYYPIGLYNNAEPTHAVASRGGTMFLIVWEFLLFTTTFGAMVIAGIEHAETGSNVAQLMFMMTLTFCGVLASKDSLPDFWVFMYYVSPFTYLVGAVLSTGVAETDVKCSSIELATVSPPAGKTCEQYLSSYIESSHGRLLNPNATSACQICSVATTDDFLASIDIKFSDRFRNVGILFIYIFFNLFAALALYWLVRVPKKKDNKVKKE